MVSGKRRRAKLLLRRKRTHENGDIQELVVWLVERDARHPQGVRYRLAFVPRGARGPAVLYDNHHPKGHHKHVAGLETSYPFTTVERLLEDFEHDIANWKNKRP